LIPRQGRDHKNRFAGLHAVQRGKMGCDPPKIAPLWSSVGQRHAGEGLKGPTWSKGRVVDLSYVQKALLYRKKETTRKKKGEWPDSKKGVECRPRAAPFVAGVWPLRKRWTAVGREKKKGGTHVREKRGKRPRVIPAGRRQGSVAARGEKKNCI